MDLGFADEYEQLRRDVRAWLQTAWPPRGSEAQAPASEQAIVFRRRAIEAGYLARGVPREYGGAGAELDVLAETVIRQELDRSGAPWRASVQGTHMLVPTLLEQGSESQRQRYIAPTLTGEMLWCQGYSEPGSGSDLASLQSRAQLDGDEWVIHGHKIWTSNAREADMMFGLFRTEPEQARSGGISYLLVPMQTRGIDVRPLRMMNGGEDFCEVFFDDVRIPAENIVGERGAGWQVSRATLKHERMLIGDSSYLRRSFDLLVERARTAKRLGDPVVRQSLAETEGYLATLERANQRMLTAIAQGRDADVMAEMVTAKLYSTNINERIVALALDLLGPAALEAPDPKDAGMGFSQDTPSGWTAFYMGSLGSRLGGGTSNIQRNIIGEILLGLPRDPRPPQR